jgi:hypothetical protein
MTRSLQPRSGSLSRNLVVKAPVNGDGASAVFWTLPQLIVDHANLPATAMALAERFVTAGGLFEQGSQVVKITRSANGDRVERLNVHGVILAAHDLCRPVELRKVGGATVLEFVTLPNQVATLFLHAHGRRGLPTLRGICAAPLLSSDGSIRCGNGYDLETGFWCVGVELPSIPERPSLENAEDALRRLRSAFATFPFADAERYTSRVGSLVDLTKPAAVDETSCILALMSAVCRPSLPFAPALLIRAPQFSGAGTGKGLLIQAIARIAFNQPATAFTSRGNRQELDRRIESALIDAGPMLYLDNCNTEELSSNVLAQVITESAVMTRLLGRSKMVPLITNAFIAVTGNAVRISEDLSRRFLVVELDAKCENPEQRAFGEDFSALIKSHRADLLGAVLTIWRWGRQTNLVPGLPLGSFEQWASWCRDPLLALGCADPVQRAAAGKSQDPLRHHAFEILHAWHEQHGSTWIKLRDLNPNVTALLGGSRQKHAAFVRDLEGTRLGGYVLTIKESAGKWGKAEYRVRRENDSI